METVSGRSGNSIIDAWQLTACLKRVRKVKRLRMLEDAQTSMFKLTAGENRDVI
jgi:hypothetical protein